MRRVVRATAGLVGAGTAAVLAVACSGSPVSPTDEEDAGLGDTVVAIVMSTPIEKAVHGEGRLILVDADGGWSSRFLADFQINSATYHRGGVHAAEGEREVRVDADGTWRMDRGAEHLMGEWAGSAGDHVITLFNPDMRGGGSDKTSYRLSAWTGDPGDPPLLAQVGGDEVLGASTCGKNGYFVVDNWDSGGGRRLLRARVADGELRVIRVGSLDGPPARGVEWDSLHCANGKLAAYTTGRARDAKRQVRHLGPIDLRTGETRTFDVSDREALSVHARVEGGHAVVWHEYRDRDPRVRVVDVRTGRVIHDITVMGLDKQAGKWNMHADGDPVFIATAVEAARRRGSSRQLLGPVGAAATAEKTN